jgi:uncharacterized protein (DUF1778 family)
MKRKARVSRKDSQIRVRVTREQKETFVRTAEQSGLDVSSWLRAIGMRAAQRERGRQL